MSAKPAQKAPKAEPTPLDQPSRRTIDLFFSDLLRGRLLEEYSSAHAEYDKAREEERELEEALLDNPQLKRLKGKRKRAWNKWYDVERKFKQRVIELKLEYQVKGLTPDVKKKVIKLVEDIKSCR